MALIRGSNKSDTLNGKKSTDVIFGRSGNDTIDGKRGRDLIDAGNGNDTVRGGRDNDTILGGSGTDTAVYVGSVDGITFKQIKGGFLQVRGPDGRDLLKSVEFLKIGDKTYSTKGPIARTDNVELTENQRIDINALANDQSLSKGALKIQKLGGGIAGVGDSVAVVDGIVVKLGANGRLTFDPGDTYDNLSAGETLQREFTYAVGNGSGHLASATVKLTIRGRNDAPVTVSDAASTDEGTTLTIAASTLLSNDSDIDRLDVLAVSAVAATANTHGTVILDNGQITYTPEAGYSGPAYFSYTVSDGQGGTATGTVNVEVLTPAAGFAHTVRVVDPNGLATDQYEELVSNLSAAVNNWARYITGQGSIDIDLVITQENANASAASTTNTPIGTFEGKTLVRDSVPHELMTGEDLNGAAADGTVFVPIGYLQTFLWLDPNPAGRTDPVPGDKTDGLSVFMHEFGHVLGMTGFGEPDGTLTGETASVYDSLITFMGDNAFFSGQTAASVFGGPVPLSNPNRGNQNNYAHYGRETSDGLDANLMEGNTFFFNGTRYDIEQIDLAIMRDMGLSVGDQWLIA